MALPVAGGWISLHPRKALLSDDAEVGPANAHETTSCPRFRGVYWALSLHTQSFTFVSTPTHKSEIASPVIHLSIFVFLFLHRDCCKQRSLHKNRTPFFTASYCCCQTTENPSFRISQCRCRGCPHVELGNVLIVLRPPPVKYVL